MTQTSYRGRVGYIGLGDMGGGIATHLAEVGVRLVVHDLNQQKMNEVAAKGADVAQSVREAVEGSDVVVVCVDPEPQVEAVVKQMIPHLGDGQTVVVQSSVSPQLLHELADAVAATGARLFDAAVSGDYNDRRNGTLAVLVGAREADVGEVKGLLESIGSPLYLETLGGGEIVKLANNSIMSLTRLGAQEAMEFARAYGIPEATLIQALQRSSAASHVIDRMSYFDEHVLDGFTLRMAPKQAELILEAAAAKNVRLRMTEAARDHTVAITNARYEYLTRAKRDQGGGDGVSADSNPE